MSTVFLTLDEVLEIHRDQIDRYGGSTGIRDLGLLESAISMPRASFGGQMLHSDLHHVAAAYLFHIVQNHPFVDGNKRVGAVAAYVFLAVNDMDLIAKETDYEELVLSVARSETDKDAIAEFFKQNVSKSD